MYSATASSGRHSTTHFDPFNLFSQIQMEMPRDRYALSLFDESLVPASTLRYHKSSNLSVIIAIELDRLHKPCAAPEVVFPGWC
jgi:hypothetical protein